MSKIIRVITTVGTSLITNYMNDEIRRASGKKYEDFIYGNRLERLDEFTANEILEGEQALAYQIKENFNKYWIKGYGKDRDGKWCANKGKYNEDCCAEIKTLLELYKSKCSDRDLKLEVYLIVSDTARSALSAKVIEENIGHFNENISVEDIIVVNGLQTDDYKKFESEGINNLFKELVDKVVESEQKFKAEDIIINISGGFKIVIPYMTLFAQVYGIKSVYIYENSSSLITIPSLPLQIDWAFAEEYYPYLSDSISVKDKTRQDFLRRKGLLKYEKGKYLRTSLGNFFYNAIEKELPVSKSVMGYFFEYKLYEYYINEPYKGRYNIVKHSELLYEDNNPKHDVEIDLLLSSDDKNKDYIVVEVKSLFILKRLDDLKKQIKKHIKTMSHIEYAKEYHLCMYTPDSRKFIRLYDDEIEKLKELKELFEDISTDFKAFIIKANYNKMYDYKGRENSNPYQQLMKDKLEKNKNFKELKF